MHDQILTWLFALGADAPVRLGIIIGYEQCLHVAHALGVVWGGAYQCLPHIPGSPT